MNEQRSWRLEVEEQEFAAAPGGQELATDEERLQPTHVEWTPESN